MSANEPTAPTDDPSSSFDWSTYVAVAIIVLSALWYFKSSRPAKTPPRIIPAVVPKRPQKTAEAEPTGTVPLRIYYGSQTGTAEEFANTLAKEARRYQFKPQLIDLEEFDADELESGNETASLFVVATYGEGEPTDSAKEFDTWLMSPDRATDALKGLRFTVFGLGNKTYEHYNAIARKFDARLEELQGQRLFRRGEGDDDANLEDDFAAWRRELWPLLCDKHGLDASKASADVVERKYRIVWAEAGTPDAEQGTRMLAGHLVNTRVFMPKAPRPAAGYDAKQPFVAPIVVNRELHHNSPRSCRHVEIDIGKSLKYVATAQSCSAFVLSPGFRL
eukprot:TRINITY_DN1846_c0_g1_i1.p1 TRINITY_DN1846_c0_g1~~TRINITY_DN1846_c0_g1_i1.p1  ORF type:complete len:334 (+),score=127.35 TRINITY_DN1846_c0_g1_i1:159-1160(+)